jgi:FtsZ-binding cell division protein ZapB
MFRDYKKEQSMDALQLLEEKISSLVAIIKELKEKNKQLSDEVGNLSTENMEIAAKHAKMADENSQLVSKVAALEKKALEGNDQIDELNQEKALTKIAVDDLLERLKSIDSLVEKQ